MEFEHRLTIFHNQISKIGQREYQFQIGLPDWLPTSFIIQSDFTKHGRREAKVYYKLEAKIEPIQAKNELSKDRMVFKTRRPIVIMQKSGISGKHFFEETEDDYANREFRMGYMNPPITLRQSKTILRAAVDRVFYYCGDTVTVNLYIDNTEAEHDVNGVEL